MYLFKVENQSLLREFIEEDAEEMEKGKENMKGEGGEGRREVGEVERKGEGGERVGKQRRSGRKGGRGRGSCWPN